MLKVTCPDTPGTDATRTFGDDVRVIRFGRAKECEVRFPPTMTAVSRRHFALILKPGTGTYTFDLSSKKPVFREGVAVMAGSELSGASEVALGRLNGPRVRLEPVDATSQVPPTDQMEAQPELVEVLAQQRKPSRWLVASLLAVAVAVVALGVILTRTFTAQEDIAALIAQQSTWQAQGDDLAGLIEKTKPAVFMVASQTSGGELTAQGTAWVFRLPSGEKALATNAHVARIHAQLEASGQMLVVVPPGGGALRVTRVELHPAYEAFNSVMAELAQKMDRRELRWMRFPSSYDVAIMWVEDPSALPEPLPIAQQAVLESLRAGERLYLVGYPMEDLLGTDVTHPEPQSQQGFITSVTTFYLTYDPNNANRLIQHSIPVAGGASGSPVLNTEGQVVALLNGANVEVFAKPSASGGYFEDRTPSAALVNYAQRADLLVELANGTAAERMPEYVEEWATLEQSLRRSVDAIVAEFQSIFDAGRLSLYNVVIAERLQGVMAETLEVEEINRPRVSWMEVAVDPAAVEHFFVTVSNDYRSVGLLVLDDQGRIASITDAVGFFSWTSVETESAGSVRIGVYDGSDVSTAPDDRQSAGEVVLVVYKAMPM